MNSKTLGIAFIFFGLILIILPLFQAPKVQTETERPKKFLDTINIPVPISFDLLHPGLVADSKQKALFLLIFNKLIRINENFEFEPDVLQNWEYFPEEKKYKFQVKEGIHFHNGQVMTAKDIIFSMHQWVSKGYLESGLLHSIEGADEYLSGASYISGIKEIKPLEFEVKLKTFDDKFLLNLTSPRFVIFPDNFAKFNPQDYFIKPIGTGPYKILSISPDYTEMLLDRHSAYFMGKPYTKRIKLKNIPEKEIVRYVQEGTVDALFFYDNPELSSKNFTDFLAIKVKTFKKMLLIFNTKNQITSDIKVRKALTRILLEKPSFEKCFSFYKQTQSIIPEGFIGHKEREKLPLINDQGSLSRAKGLRIHFENFPNIECYSKEINKKLASFDIKIINSEFNKMYELLKADQLSVWFEIIGYKNEDPYNILQYFRPTSNEYLIGGHYPLLQRYYEELDENADILKKHKIYAKIEDFLIQNYLTIPVLDFDTFLVFKKNMTTPQVSGANYYINNWHEIGIIDNQ